jgi:hypothetical protein
MKAVYDDGHLVEAAVFRADELEVTRANEYEVLLDRGGIARCMEEIRSATARAVGPHDPAFLAGQFVTNLLVGCARFGRGERLSGHDFVKGQAVGHLLRLAGAVLPPVERGVADDLDPWRRVERAVPALATEIDAALLMPVPEAAAALLDAAETHVAPHTPDWPPAAATIRRFLVAVIADGASGSSAGASG